MKHNIGLTRKEEWDKEWQKWYARYSKGFPRIGTWIEINYPLAGLEILEIGAGSARESMYLARRAKSVTCTDFSESVIKSIRSSNPPRNVIATPKDAFQLGFPSQSFDITFHKGFWILFEDQDIARLFREQLRVTTGLLLALVHNSRNKHMVEDFACRGQEDPLFQVRFFDPAVLSSFLLKEMSAAGYSGKIRVRKFGGVNWLFKYRLPSILSSIRNRLASMLYQLLPWSHVESIVIEIRLTKSQPARRIRFFNCNSITRFMKSD